MTDTPITQSEREIIMSTLSSATIGRRFGCSATSIRRMRKLIAAGEEFVYFPRAMPPPNKPRTRKAESKHAEPSAWEISESAMGPSARERCLLHLADLVRVHAPKQKALFAPLLAELNE